MSLPSWDLLICSIPHRDATMCELLGELDAQMRPGVGVITFRDNLQVAYGDKIARMLAYSTADYVSCVDDDDMIAPDFIRRVQAALESRPDYVGFQVRYTSGGHPQVPVEHSLRYRSWENREHILVRDIVQFNPIRRELALLGTWEGGYAADGRWAEGVRASGQCKTEVFIPGQMYYYRYNPEDYFRSPREPLAAVPPLPEYPWLTVLEP
jgi:hypothetical protein